MSGRSARAVPCCAPPATARWVPMPRTHGGSARRPSAARSRAACTIDGSGSTRRPPRITGRSSASPVLHSPERASTSRSAKRKHLLGAGQRAFVVAELGREALDAADIHLHHLVNGAQVGRVAGGGELRAHAEGVDGRAGGHQFADAVLVQVAADHDLRRPAGPRRPECRASARESERKSPLSMRTPHSGRPTSAAWRVPANRVVGVDQLHGRRAQHLLQLREGLAPRRRTTSPRSAPRCPSPGCRSGSPPACCWCRRSRRCRPRARPARRPPGVCARRVPNSTTARPSAASDDARRLGGDQRLEGHGGEQRRFPGSAPR